MKQYTQNIAENKIDKIMVKIWPIEWIEYSQGLRYGKIWQSIGGDIHIHIQY